MSIGYVKMYRALADSELWLAEPFSKGQAWADLILNANFRERSLFIAGQQITVRRGQLAWSEVTLGKRWKWSRGKVRRFLSMLKADGKIEQNAVQHTSIITICKYEKFQAGDTSGDTPESTPDGTPDSTADETPSDTPDGTTGGTQEKKGKKDKKEKKGKAETTLPDDFEVTEGMKAWFVDQGFTIDCDKATSRWKDSMKAKGRKYKDWSAAWRNGMKIAQEWHNERREKIQPVGVVSQARVRRQKILPGSNPKLLPGEWIEDGYLCAEVSA